jgi:hypothetical protein
MNLFKTGVSIAALTALFMRCGWLVGGTGAMAGVAGPWG